VWSSRLARGCVWESHFSVGGGRRRRSEEGADSSGSAPCEPTSHQRYVFMMVN